MSTTNPIAPGLPGTQGEYGGLPLVAGHPSLLGLPSAEAIAGLANALFATLPGKPSVSGTSADIGSAPPSSALAAESPVGVDGELASSPVAAHAPPTSGFAPAGDAELRSAPASLSNVGGVASPLTAGNPATEPGYYFLQADHAPLPGAIAGIGSSSANRADVATLPAQPSSPAAFAQPAEPNPRTVPNLAGAGIAQPGGGSPIPFAFKPELVADTGSVPLGSGLTATPPATPVQQPDGLGLPPAETTTPYAPSALTEEAFGPRGSLGGAGLPSESSFYFLPKAGGNEPNPVQTSPALDAIALPDDRLATYPLDHRATTGGLEAQDHGKAAAAPKGGAPSAVPGRETLSQSLGTHPGEANPLKGNG